MWQKDKGYLGSEHRKYIRLDSVFPVQFRLLSLDRKQVLSGWLQGFTNNIGKGGICLEINNLQPHLAQNLKNRQAKVHLNIEMPITVAPITAIASVAWIKDIVEQADKYLIGLSYEQIDARQNNRIVYYARMKKLFVPVTLSLIIMLGLGFAINSFINVKLIKGNKALVEQLIKIVQESSVAKQKIKGINKEKEDLQLKIDILKTRIQTTEEEKKQLAERTKLEGARISRKAEELNIAAEKLIQEKADLQEQLIGLQHKENRVTEELLFLDKRKASLEKANLDKMYQWLKIHQNPRTGLVMSFEGDKDIENWAFIYDQALAMQCYTYFGDFERARKTIDFFYKKAKKEESGFFNAYYVNDGSPAEYTVHSGPNIWLGIAILQYTQRSQDRQFLRLAEEIAQATIRLQNADAEGGIRGGPNVEWYATEHNLDAYAFFNMLYKVTANSQYLQARDKVLNWLIKHIYNKVDMPIKRGKGDSTIAMDTYAWSIAALGPEKLDELGINPEGIIEFAEENCSVEVSFSRPGGQAIKIKGFDFAPQRHVAKGGVVSSEWTAQMVLAFKIMADFYYQKNMVAKARAYELKADTYLVELANMIISSPSPSGQGESCLPYATQDYVDTGHGWMTPKGSRTGSVAGTAYAIFAYYKYNPLQLQE